MDKRNIKDLFGLLRIKNILLLYNKSKEDLIKDFDNNEQLVENFLNSNPCYIKITKISNNPGYLYSGEVVEGWCPTLCEGLSCNIKSGIRDYYYTSNIKSIDWENKVFFTKNSTYSFDIIDSFDHNELLNLINEYERESKENE